MRMDFTLTFNCTGQNKYKDLSQVVWLGRPSVESTWEPQSSLPPALIIDYENGIKNEIHSEVVTAGGHTIHTLSTTSSSTENIPSPKRVRVELSDVTVDSSG